MSNERINIVLTKEQLNIVTMALGEIPLKSGLEVFQTIQNQYQAQVMINQGENNEQTNPQQEIETEAIGVQPPDED